MLQPHTLYSLNRPLPSTCQPPRPPTQKDSRQNRDLFLPPLGALPSPPGAHTSAVLGARLARFRAPWPLCSNAEPQQLRHGGGSSAGLALLPSPLLELRAHSRWTHFLPEVNMTRGRGSAEPRCSLSRRILYLCLFPTSRFTFPPRFLPPTAKRRRAQPGCIRLPGRLWSPGTGKLQVRTHTPHAREGYPRVTVEGGENGR